MIKTFAIKITAAICALSLVFGSIALTVSAASSADYSVAAATESKPDFNYVAFGASNTNGYGLHGYNYDYVYEAPFEKAVGNRYGYKMDAPGSYPTLVSEKLSEKYNVNLSLIAMSSMRAEEVRFLLDENYMGDSYTDTWLYDTNGDGVSSNWCYYAGVYEWNLRAEAGLEGYDHEPSYAEALATLRDACRIAVEESDLITIDAGMNSFGTYMLNLLGGGKIFTSDIGTIDLELGAFYDKAKTFVLATVDNLTEGKISADLLSGFADTLAYAIVGYCTSMDAIMDRIYTLKPDANVVVVGIQSIMSDLDLVLPGIDVALPLGEIFDYIVNSANLYVATLSPYADRYLYANASENSHTEFFMDEIADYNGDPASLSVNLKDCLDVYDETFFLKTRIQQKFAILMSESGRVNIADSLKDTQTTEGIAAFHYGFHYDFESKYNSPVVTVADGTPLKDFIKAGEEGRLAGESLEMYKTYERMVMTAYDVAAEIMREGASASLMDLSAILTMSALGLSANDIILKAVDNALAELSEDSGYTFSIQNEYPEGYFEALAAEYNVSVNMIDTLFAYSMRLSFGGTIFSHPNDAGHAQVYDYIMDAYDNGIKGNDVLVDQLNVDYLPTEDSYYLAISNTSADYASLFAEAVGIGNERYGKTTLNSPDYDAINKADIISIFLGEEETLGFAIEQAASFIGNYIVTDARLTLINYITSIVRGSAILSTLNFETMMINRINYTVIDFLEDSPFADTTVEEMDWSKLLGEEYLPYVELARTELKKVASDFLGSEKYTVEIDVVDWLNKNADSFGLSHVATAILKNTNFLYDILLDKAFLQLDIPIVDGIALAMESYLYKYIESTVKSGELISYINANNPDAKILMLNSFNPIKCTSFAIGDSVVSIGDAFDTVTLLSSVRNLVRFATSDNLAFVHIPEARSAYEISVEKGLVGEGIMDFLLVCINDARSLGISTEDSEYIAERMLRFVNILCNHGYDSECDSYCNKCGEERAAVPHVRVLCSDTVCSACKHDISPVEHSFGEWKTTIEAGVLHTGEEQRACSACSVTETRTTPAKGVENANESEIALLFVNSLVVVAILAIGGVCLYFFAIKKKLSGSKKENTPAEPKE